MNLPVVHRIYSSKPTAFLLLMLMLIIPLSAHATPYVYTYTGKPFMFVRGPDFPLSASNYHMNINFTYDGDLQVDSYELPFTMSDGVHALDAVPGPACILDIYEVSGGLPTRWSIIAYDGASHGMGTSVTLVTINGVTSKWLQEDSRGWTGYNEVDATFFGYVDDDWIAAAWKREGTAPVPEPATLLLLGSGLLGLAATRKRKRS